MVDVSKVVHVSASILPEEMGMVFAGMDCTEQARFFYGIAKTAKAWPKDAGFQWVMMREALDQFPGALDAFKKMAEYAEDLD